MEQLLLCISNIADLAHKVVEENEGYKAEITALREQLAEKDRLLAFLRSEFSKDPLTLQEVLELSGPTPLWIEGDFKPHWELVEWIPVAESGRKLFVEALEGESDCVLEADIRETYGGWHYYRHPPEKMSL